MMSSSEQILERLRSFAMKIDLRLTKALRKDLDRIIKDYTIITGAVAKELDRTSIKGCCEALASLKQFHIHNLEPKTFGLMLEEGWTMQEIGWLYNATFGQIQVKKRHLEGIPKASELTSFELPPFLANKKPETLTDEDLATIARLRMAKEAMTGNLEAAQKLMTNFSSTMKVETKKKWEEVKKIDYFYMTIFLTELIKAHKLTDPLPRIKAEIGPIKREVDEIGEIHPIIPKIKETLNWLQETCDKGRVDIKAIYRKLLGDLETDIKQTAADALDGMVRKQLQEADEERQLRAEKRAKRRGTFTKKRKSWLLAQEEAASKGKPPGVMESPDPPEEGPMEEVAEGSAGIPGENGEVENSIREAGQGVQHGNGIVSCDSVPSLPSG